MNATVDQLKREFEKIVDRKNPIMLEHKPVNNAGFRAWEKSNKAWNDCYYCHPNTSQAMTFQKRVRALAHVMPNLYVALVPIVNEALAKQAEIMLAKDAALKARNDKKAVAQAKRDEQAEIKRNPYHGLDPQVAEILKQVAEPYRVKAVAMETIRLANQLEEIKRLGAMFGSFDPYVMFASKKDDRYHNQVISFKRLEAHKFLAQKSVDFVTTWSLKPDADMVVVQKAEEFGNDMVTAFIHKTGTKLSGIVERKHGNHKVTISGGSLQDYWMHFTFADGSTFDVQTQVIWKTSINGVYFPQFPTCFRNVKLANGTKMELPSEAKMKEQFV